MHLKQVMIVEYGMHLFRNDPGYKNMALSYAFLICFFICTFNWKSQIIGLFRWLIFYTDCFLPFQAVKSGLLKILSKMGISLLSRYELFFKFSFYLFFGE